MADGVLGRLVVARDGPGDAVPTVARGSHERLEAVLQLCLHACTSSTNRSRSADLSLRCIRGWFGFIPVVMFLSGGVKDAGPDAVVTTPVFWTWARAAVPLYHSQDKTTGRPIRLPGVSEPLSTASGGPGRRSAPAALDRVRRPTRPGAARRSPPAEPTVEAPGPMVGLQAPQHRLVGTAARQSPTPPARPPLGRARRPSAPDGRRGGAAWSRRTPRTPRVRVAPSTTSTTTTGIGEGAGPTLQDRPVRERVLRGREHVGEPDQVGLPLEVAQRDGVARSRQRQVALTGGRPPPRSGGRRASARRGRAGRRRRRRAPAAG